MLKLFDHNLVLCILSEQSGMLAVTLSTNAIYVFLLFIHDCWRLVLAWHLVSWLGRTISRGASRPDELIRRIPLSKRAVENTWNSLKGRIWSWRTGSFPLDRWQRFTPVMFVSWGWPSHDLRQSEPVYDFDLYRYFATIFSLKMIPPSKGQSGDKILITNQKIVLK